MKNNKEPGCEEDMMADNLESICTQTSKGRERESTCTQMKYSGNNKAFNDYTAAKFWIKFSSL